MGAFRFDRVVGSQAAGRGRLDPRKKLSKKTNANNVISVDFTAKRALRAA